MTQGYRGTFVISWMQTSIDGEADAPFEALKIGAAWYWSGEPVRVDGPASVGALGDDSGDANIRPRAARMVRRLVGASLAKEKPQPSVPAQEDLDTLHGDSSFVVTDGHKGYTVTLIPVGRHVPPLLMFLDEVPPADTDLWVVHAAQPVDPGEVPTDPGGAVICFTPQTHILTPGGPVPVGLLREGDLVQTKDSGAQPICWMGRRRMSGARLFAMPTLRPILLQTGALGLDQPNRELRVSPEHRMVIRGARARALFNTPEVLVSARDLVDGHHVVQDTEIREVTYVHLLLPRHEVLFADGVETESFHPANAAIISMDGDDRQRLLQTLPGVAGNPQSYGTYARRNLSSSEAAILLHDAA